LDEVRKKKGLVSASRSRKGIGCVTEIKGMEEVEGVVDRLSK
jgi:hypothetical protein